MTGTVILPRQELDESLVLSGRSVSSASQWYPAAFAANWLSGQCATLVPGVTIDKNVIASTTGVLHFKAKTRNVAIERVWVLGLRSDTAVAATVTIKAPASTGTALGPITIDTARGRTPIIYREILTAQASAVTDLTIEIAAAVGDCIIDSISCFELTRPLLGEDATDYGVNEQTMRPRERIFDGTGYQSATGVFGAMLTAEPRRVLYQWAVPVVTPITTTGAYTDILTLGVPHLARFLTLGSTTTPVWWSAYAKVSSGSGDVKLTSSVLGLLDSVNVTATSFGWTAARQISVSAEDLSVADGRRGSAWDEVMPAFRANGGVTTSLAAISIWDEEV